MDYRHKKSKPGDDAGQVPGGLRSHGCSGRSIPVRVTIHQIIAKSLFKLAYATAYVGRRSPRGYSKGGTGLRGAGGTGA